MRISKALLVGTAMPIIYGCSAFQNRTTINQGSATLALGEARLNRERACGPGATPDSLDLELRSNGSVTQSVMGALDSSMSGHTFKLAADAGRSRAWVIDETSGRVLLSADFVAKTYWKDVATQPDWAKP